MAINPTSPPPAALAPAPDGWRELANCVTTDPDVFFAENGDYVTTRWAKRVCSRCLVRAECLDYALSFSHVEGVWGGTTPMERRALRRKRRAAA